MRYLIEPWAEQTRKMTPVEYNNEIVEFLADYVDCKRSSTSFSILGLSFTAADEEREAAIDASLKDSFYRLKHELAEIQNAGSSHAQSFEERQIVNEMCSLFESHRKQYAELYDEVQRRQILDIPKTQYPDQFIIPKDRVSNRLISGKLTDRHNLQMERKGAKNKLTATVSINLDGLEDLQISKNFTLYDWQVHNSIVSLFVDGGNEFITPLMIYRTMTGDPGAKLTENISRSILESITKCSATLVKIDAEDEAKAWGMDQLIYEGNLLYTERITGVYNGQIGEWIRILRRPVLYDYANSKSQIARMDIRLLNTPVYKTAETILLQSYLQGRILAMKGSNKLSRNILYSTIYKQLDIEAGSPGALRKKQSKVRRNVKRILGYWKDENFIVDFEENTGARNTKTSVSIEL